MTTATTPTAEHPVLRDWVGRTAQRAFPAVAFDELRAADRAAAWRVVGEAAGCDEASLAATLAASARVPLADLSAPDPRLATFIPASLARKHDVVPLRADQRTIWIAASDPFDMDAEQALGFVTSRAVIFELAGPAAIAQAFEVIYEPGRNVARLIDGLDARPSDVVVEAPEEPEPVVEVRDPALDAPVSRLIDAMLADAVRDGASDVHIEPSGSGVVVRYRVDGVLRDVMKLPEATGPALVRRIKVLARLDVTNAMRPQDGRMTARVGGQMVDLRVSTLPVARRGEKVVIRILDKRHLRADLASLGLADEEQQLLRRLVGQREGLLLVTGPTGSGKTTTLYAVLNQLRTGRVNITTVEDPVEYEIPDIAQIQVNEAQGLTFAAALRSVLRQDPDVVLVGEIRDAETADVAVQASMTGHLVLSTLHTNDAPSAAARLRDMGVDGFKLGATLVGIVAQRLVRALCDKCSAVEPITALPPDAQPPAGQPAAPRRAVGCEACGNSGYRGRLPVVEILLADPQLARQIEAGDGPAALASTARRNGMRSLWESGLLRVWDGRTTVDELRRVLGERTEETTAESRRPATAAPAPVAPVAPTPAPAPALMRAPVAAAPVPSAPPDDGGAASRVLVVDDDPQMRRFVRMVLEREQHTVIEAGDGLEALEALQTQAPSLVIMDLDMPRLDGMATLEEIREQPATARLPVILLTARTEDESVALDKGASDFLAKPLQPKTLAARVRAVLRRAQL